MALLLIIDPVKIHIHLSRQRVRLGRILVIIRDRHAALGLRPRDIQALELPSRPITRGTTPRRGEQGVEAPLRGSNSRGGRVVKVGNLLPAVDAGPLEAREQADEPVRVQQGPVGRGDAGEGPVRVGPADVGLGDVLHA